MSENDFDVQHQRAQDERDDLVLTGEEIELPGEDSDASAIIGESSAPIHTGEIESVAIGGLTGRVPAAAPLKPAIEDRISTGELPVVPPVTGTTDASSDDTKTAAEPAREQADAPAPDSSADKPDSPAPTPSTESKPSEEPTLSVEASADASGQAEADASGQAEADASDESPEPEPADTAPADDAETGATPGDPVSSAGSTVTQGSAAANEEAAAVEEPAAIEELPAEQAPVDETAPLPTQEPSAPASGARETPASPIVAQSAPSDASSPASRREAPEPIEQAGESAKQAPEPAEKAGESAEQAGGSTEQAEDATTDASPADVPFSSLDTSTREDDASTDEAAEDAGHAQGAAAEEPGDATPTHSPVMTPAQAAAMLGLNLDAAQDRQAPKATKEAPSARAEATPPDAEAPTQDASGEIGGAAATHSLPSRRTIIFGDEAPAASIPPLASSPTETTAVRENAALRPYPAADTAATLEESTAGDAPASVAHDAGPLSAQDAAGSPDTVGTDETTQLPTHPAPTSYSFEDQDAAEAARPRRRSVLADGDREAATLAAIASAGRGGTNAGGEARLDDELFSAAPQVTEMPSRTGAHWISFLGFLLLTPVAWFLAADAGARMTLADSAPMYTGIASFQALGELAGAVLVCVILFALARRSSLGAWIMGVLTLAAGLPWVLAPGVTASSLLSALTSLSQTGPVGANLMHHLQASGYSGRFVVLGALLMGVAYVSHSARRTGRAEEALRTSLETTNPAEAFYSKRARKRAAKDTGRK
ncbi:hypothetical protein [Cellulomonas flavigena]|uniref:hypothetical protein n=1 Tax=Cellulomonas flavigena TaxID=1711 RepID=UPI00069CC115|nr:hypothetical protein [Cellulomonas flavigena]